ncbi:hypothetical protein CsSME_00042326 [Camellia sinensis var. sinensis]
MPIISNFGERIGSGPIGVAAQSLIENGSSPLSGLVGNVDVEGSDLYQSKGRRVRRERRKMVTDSRWVRRMARSAGLVRKKGSLPMEVRTVGRFSKL